MKKRILVTGANGQLGNALLQKSTQQQEYDFDFKTKTELDLSSAESIEASFQKPYDFLINAGAYTKVDQAETDSELCFSINGTALKYLAKFCPDSCSIIHLSTDYVYDHNPGRPLLETDETNPRSIYAKSKLLGEDFLREFKKEHIILRTSWVYAEHGHNFVKSMLRLGQEKESLSIVADQVGSPSYASDIADAILGIMSRLSDESVDSKSNYGTYNFSNGGQTNWADFARFIFSRAGISCQVNDSTTEKYNAPAPRPLWSVMSKEKIEKNFNIPIKSWESSLDICLARLLNNE